MFVHHLLVITDSYIYTKLTLYTAPLKLALDFATHFKDFLPVTRGVCKHSSLLILLIEKWTCVVDGWHAPACLKGRYRLLLTVVTVFPFNQREKQRSQRLILRSRGLYTYSILFHSIICMVNAICFISGRRLLNLWQMHARINLCSK